ncbi:MAG: phosphatidylinositol-specific phospholipase C1-like protein [Acidimicrobiia bacterium]|nr:phosphatidylinositol-specific phospholipase C1-like protein [Acidimicrobiia bacterium]
MAGLVLGAVLIAACSSGGSDSGSPDEPTVDLNQIQVLGSHNSYHLQPREEIFTVLEGLSKELAESIEYSHVPLDEQFTEHGVRQIEIDVFADPEGGLYADQAANPVVDLPEASGIPELDEPGFKVLHTQDFDYATNCLTLTICLEEVEAWSSANPDHVPVMVMIEGKQETIEEAAGELGDGVEIPDLGFTEPVRFTPELFDDLDAEITSVIPEEMIITPDDVRGDHDTLEEAVLEDGWPSLDDSRGKIMFALVNTGDERDVYLEGHASLEGRVMFTSSEPGEPDAAFLRLDDPIEEGEQIMELVEAGYLIRTRSDTPTADARNNDTTRRDAALASGAQFVSTDYEVPDSMFGTGYVVSIPGGTPARCNPVNAPADCTPEAIAEPSG